MANAAETTIEGVREYYGKVLQKSSDLKTDACCTRERMPGYIIEAIKECHEEVVSKYYGCGLVIPEAVQGLAVLDLGSGAGRDCYVLSQLVGSGGRVLGVDMTEEQIAVAIRHKEYHAKKFGFANVDFRHGYIETLAELGLADASFDLIVSNCVVNLSPDKEAVLSEAFRVLKPGGEMYFRFVAVLRDVYASSRVPVALAEDKELYGECLSGAMYWNDFLVLAKKVGFTDPRLVKDSPITLKSSIAEKMGDIRFYSATYRLFKVEGLEGACEDYGQAVRYKGTLEQHPVSFSLDGHHTFSTGKVMPVCGNTFLMLRDTRFAAHFDFFGSHLAQQRLRKLLTQRVVASRFERVASKVE